MDFELALGQMQAKLEELERMFRALETRVDAVVDELEERD